MIFFLVINGRHNDIGWILDNIFSIHDTTIKIGGIYFILFFNYKERWRMERSVEVFFIIRLMVSDSQKKKKKRLMVSDWSRLN